MALEGTLKDFSLADIFQLIGLQRKTGVLTLRGKDDTVTVTFLDGKVVSADSLNRRLENRLGHVLIRTGTLTPDQLTRALDIQRETLQRLGFILTHYGIISQESLREAIQLQILQIIYRLFRWNDGEYHFSQETTIEYDRENVVPITAESILMEGARMIDEWPIIEKKIRSYDMVFRKKLIDQDIVVVGSDEADDLDFDDSISRKRRGPVIGDKIKISTEEKSIYDLVDGTTTVADIVESSRLSDFDTNKALYDLLTRDLIEEVRDTHLLGAVEEEVATAMEAADVPPVPLPLIAILAVLAVLSILTSGSNPLSLTSDAGRWNTGVDIARKSVSFQRINTVGRSVEAHNLSYGRMPEQLTDLQNRFVIPQLLEDPWGTPYKYVDSAQKYLVIGFTPQGRADTDLFLSHSVESTLAASGPSVQETGGIILLD